MVGTYDASPLFFLPPNRRSCASAVYATIVSATAAAAVPESMQRNALEIFDPTALFLFLVPPRNRYRQKMAELFHTYSSNLWKKVGAVKMV